MHLIVSYQIMCRGSSGYAMDYTIKFSQYVTLYGKATAYICIYHIICIVVVGALLVFESQGGHCLYITPTAALHN